MIKPNIMEKGSIILSKDRATHYFEQILPFLTKFNLKGDVIKYEMREQEIILER